MAKASWNVLNKTSGTGNGSFTSGGSVHTGYKNRVSTTTVAAGALTESLVSTQLGAAAILAIATPATVAKGGNSAYEVTFESNASKLGFSISGTGFTISNCKISADGGSTWQTITSGTAITGNPGATAKYTGKFTIAVTANPGVATRTATLSATTEHSYDDSVIMVGEPVTKTITQAAGDPTLSISPLTVTIPADGTAQTVNVTSNTSWTLS